MATTDLKLDEPGSLPKPGPVGRLVRLAFGSLCLWYVFTLISVADSLLDSDGHIRQAIWNGIIIGLFLVSYVVNIGFSKAWKKWPAIVSAGFFLLIGGISLIWQGTIETRLLALMIWVWELYVYLHLGLAFVLAGLVGSPGCEMRAFHFLYSRISGNPTQEHYCPIGPLNVIDQWEARHRQN
jgi:hypothetical protein